MFMTSSHTQTRTGPQAIIMFELNLEQIATNQTYLIKLWSLPALISQFLSDSFCAQSSVHFARVYFRAEVR